jgi:hypothetical protein
MLLTIALVLVGTIALGAFELWLFWLLGERRDRRGRVGGTCTDRSRRADHGLHNLSGRIVGAPRARRGPEPMSVERAERARRLN